MIAITSTLLLGVGVILLIATCQSQPRFDHSSVPVSNNSYIYYEEINMEDDGLKWDAFSEHSQVIVGIDNLLSKQQRAIHY